MTAPGRPLQVLIVDDCDDDVELMRLEFLMQGVRAECHCVDTRAKLARALDAFAPDVVLSDLNLPGFSGREAIDAVRARRPGVPVVLLSGAFIEGEALPGADARLSKDDLKRLPGVVRGLLGG